MLIRTDLYQAPLQTFIIPVLDETLQQLTHLVPQIHSRYLYGSAARATAIQGQSDLDLTIILHHPLSEIQQAQVIQLQKSLQAQYPDITKVDFDFGLLQEALDKTEYYRWGYWLKHCCRHLQGENLQAHFPAFKPSRTIAQALNKDYAQEILKDLEKLQQADTHQLTNKMQIIIKNQICKRLIRASNIARPVVTTKWPYELNDYQALFQKWHPEHLPQLNYFYQQLKQDSFDIEALKIHALAFIKTLNSL